MFAVDDNQSKCIAMASNPNGYMYKATLKPTIQGELKKKKGQNNYKSQRIRKFAVRSCPLVTS